MELDNRKPLANARTPVHLSNAALPRQGNIHVVDQYRVVVGDVGIVFDGDSRPEALRQYYVSVIQSKTERSAAARKSVALFKDYEVIREYHPPPNL